MPVHYLGAAHRCSLVHQSGVHSLQVPGKHSVEHSPLVLDVDDVARTPPLLLQGGLAHASTALNHPKLPKPALHRLKVPDPAARFLPDTISYVGVQVDCLTLLSPSSLTRVSRWTRVPVF
ncbi:hypothetical protein ILYODFUR_009353 [Ilyodon furcidens]|uniref:Uncharacterized protein n=1 Tax=Ilyodon furcidens TaxID=33524 RepID=A0ABV0T6K6_9TELE